MCVRIIDGLMRRELLRGAWLDVTHVDDTFGMCAKQHLEECKKDKKHHAHVLVMDLYKDNIDYDEGNATVQPVGTALLSFASNAPVRVQDQLVSGYKDRRGYFVAYAELLWTFAHYYVRPPQLVS